jgi:hypothetical protein
MIDFRFERNGTGHNDIVFHLNDYSRVCDSYYFFIDYAFDPDGESVDKALKVMRKLLQQWVDVVEHLAEDHVIHLPFDFSDQYTGCIRCTLAQGELLLRAGYSNREAWRSWPSGIGNYVNSINDFKVYKEFADSAARMSKLQFKEDVFRAMERL